MDKIELIRKGREQYEMLIVTCHVRERSISLAYFCLMRNAKESK